jgi:hypothetical protein
MTITEPSQRNDPGAPAAKPNKGMTVFGRQGSPTLTLALPFAHVDVKADDGAGLVPQLAALTARLARTLQSAGLGDATAAELAAIAAALDTLGEARPRYPVSGTDQ